jgi:hypothetical protein
MSAVLPDAATLIAAARSGQRPSWQQHHIIPRSLLRREQIRAFLIALDRGGPGLINRPGNLLTLPATEQLAAATGMSMHRGPHPQYDDVVAARLDIIRQDGLSCDEARARIAALQIVLSASLSGRNGPALILNRRDPMRLFADYGALDAAIAALIDQPG